MKNAIPIFYKNSVEYSFYPEYNEVIKQCFKEGTLVACLNENGEEVRKPIETVAVGTLVLAYDEATGEKAYKPVVQVFKNETKRWCTVTVEVDGQEEQIVSTPGHKYYLPNNTESREIGLQQEHESYIALSEKWVSACKLKAGDKVLLSDGKYGIISVGEIETEAITFEEALLGTIGLLLIILAFRGLIKLIKWLKHRKKQ